MLGVPDPSQAPWGDPPARWNHYTKHRNVLRVATEQEYDESARETIRRGVRLTYRDRSTGARRVGYFERETGRFTALNEHETRIRSHFLTGERQVRALPESDYS
jgi:hypothetical protein